ncbi:MAG: hypothetical protein IJV21_03645 [Lachnospiraceae bacterium]|nr:hypothetical protein [Lachnospiraceae bacterium]
MREKKIIRKKNQLKRLRMIVKKTPLRTKKTTRRAISKRMTTILEMSLQMRVRRTTPKMSPQMTTLRRRITLRK